MFLCMFLAQMTKSGFRAAAGRMTIPHMSSILWCGKAKKKLSPTGNHGWYSFYNPANGVHFNVNPGLINQGLLIRGVLPK